MFYDTVDIVTESRVDRYRVEVIRKRIVQPACEKVDHLGRHNKCPLGDDTGIGRFGYGQSRSSNASEEGILQKCFQRRCNIRSNECHLLQASEESRPMSIWGDTYSWNDDCDKGFRRLHIVVPVDLPRQASD